MSSTSASEGRSAAPSVVDVPPVSLSRPQQQQRWIDADIEAQQSLARLPLVNIDEKSIIFCCFTNESVFRILLITYWVWTLVSFVDNIEIVFPALYLFPICSMLAALVGSATGTYQLLIPFMLITVFDTLYSSIDLFALVNLHNENKNEPILRYIDEKWPSKMQTYIRWDIDNFHGYAIAIIARMMYALIAALTAGQEITRYRMLNFVEQRRNDIYRRRMWRHDRNTRAFVSEAFNTNRAGANGGETTTSMLFTSSPTSFYTTTNIPPPPAYQTLPSLRTPTSGTPPPTYSTIERQQTPQTTNPEGISAPLPFRFDETTDSGHSSSSSPRDKSDSQT
uniref:Lysosomal cobalamin transporter n=1 Tax=Panagrellus redivivus TaxID=6233 RepID=A0A7E4VHR6_PANRE